MGKPLSTETIYVGLYFLLCGTLRSELLAALRQARKTRRSRARGADRRNQIPNMTPNVERPAEVTTRTVPDYWDGHLIKGARNGSGRRHPGGTDDPPGHLGTDGGDGCDEYPHGLFIKKLQQLPVPLRKTLTYDRGKEMAVLPATVTDPLNHTTTLATIRKASSLRSPMR